MQETWVLSLGQEDPLEKGMETHSSTLAWRIPWTEEPGGLQPEGSRKFRHYWATNTATAKCFQWRRVDRVFVQRVRPSSPENRFLRPQSLEPSVAFLVSLLHSWINKKYAFQLFIVKFVILLPSWTHHGLTVYILLLTISWWELNLLSAN